MATTTPNYGWSVPTSSDYVAQGAVAMETLGDSVDATLFTALGGAYPGLRHVKTQTVGTGVTSVTVTAAFSATYDAYRIVVNGVDATTVANATLKLGSATTQYYGSQYYDNFVAVQNGVDRNNNTLGFLYCGITSLNDDTNTSFDLGNPFLTKRTTISGTYFGSQYTGFFGGTLATTTSYTDFTFAPFGGTLTGGTISVYGYGKS